MIEENSCFDKPNPTRLAPKSEIVMKTREKHFQMQNNTINEKQAEIMESENNIPQNNNLKIKESLLKQFPVTKKKIFKIIYKESRKIAQNKNKKQEIYLNQKKKCQKIKILSKDDKKMVVQDISNVKQENKQTLIRVNSSQSDIIKENTLQMDYCKELLSYQNEDSSFESLSMKKQQPEIENYTKSTIDTENTSIHQQFQMKNNKYLENTAIIPESNLQKKQIKSEQKWESSKISSEQFQQCLIKMKQMFGCKRNDENVAEILNKCNYDIKLFESVVKNQQLDMKKQFQEEDRKNKPYYTREKNVEKIFC